jgi:hypothetical protein
MSFRFLTKNLAVFGAIGLLSMVSIAQAQTKSSSGNLVAGASKEVVLQGPENQACLQKQRLKGVDSGGALEICSVQRPACSAQGLPEGCVFSTRIPMNQASGPSGASSGAAPSKK